MIDSNKLLSAGLAADKISYSSQGWIQTSTINLSSVFS